MRATISFDADVSRVNDIMRSLVLEESNALQDALIALEKATADRIVEGISEALGHIHGVASQLEQYRQMMMSFEKAKFETMLPQDAPPPVRVQGHGEEFSSPAELSAILERAEKFGSFVDKVNQTEESGEDLQSEEG